MGRGDDGLNRMDDVMPWNWNNGKELNKITERNIGHDGIMGCRNGSLI